MGQKPLEVRDCGKTCGRTGELESCTKRPKVKEDMEFEKEATVEDRGQRKSEMRESREEAGPLQSP